jgi:uracil-DNA glycosylase family 4
VGKAGKIFREAFKLSKLDQTKYFISNVVLCANIQDGKTVNPPEEAIEKCKPNWNKLIEITNPDLIFILGSIPMKAFNIGDSGITKKRGKVFDYNGHKVLLTIHPSFVKRNGGIASNLWNIFYSDFEKACEILNPEKKLEEEVTGPVLNKPFSFKIPEKYYTEDYVLMDIQHIKDTKEVLYIFRNKEGKTEYYRTSSTKYYHYCINGNEKNSPMLLNVDKAFLGFKKSRRTGDVTFYEGDLSVLKKHAVDYRYNRGDTPEAKVSPKLIDCCLIVLGNGWEALVLLLSVLKDAPGKAL